MHSKIKLHKNRAHNTLKRDTNIREQKYSMRHEIINKNKKNQMKIFKKEKSNSKKP